MSPLHILRSVPTGVKYKEVTAVLENCCGDCYLVETFRTQPRRRVQHAGESLQEFAAAMGHLVYCAYVDSTEQHISREVACAFADMVRERDLR